MDGSIDSFHSGSNRCNVSLSFHWKEADAVPALDNVDQIVDVFYHLNPELEEKPGNFFAR